MSEKLYVFDFDKTLTNKDSIVGFYLEVNKRNGFLNGIIKRFVLLLSSILYKLKIVSNSKLKKIGVHLFLKGVHRKEIDLIALTYSKKIILNKIYYEVFKKIPQEQRLVSSASYEEYLKYIFPNENIVGSTLNYKLDKVHSLKINNYGIEKAKHTNNIHSLYTDSYSDKPLMDKSKNVFLVKGVEIKKVK